jgi:copper chaperone CopZ
MATTSAPTVETFSVIGMTCRHCELAVSAELAKLPGVDRVVVDVAAGTVITTSDRPLPRPDVAAAIDDAGYQLA